tara:strand:- start:119 stop:325 length:207 start_codon:yes stop_codon:yes gene_type:complete
MRNPSVARNNREAELEMMESLGFDMMNEIVGMNYNNLQILKKYIEEYINELDQEKKVQRTVELVKSTD